LESIIEKLNKKIYKNITPGQGIISINQNLNTQLNKVSSTNPKNIFIEYEVMDDNKKKRKNKVRRLNTEIPDNPILDINKENITSFIKKEESDNLGFYSLLYKNKHLPVETNSTRKIFSENSLNFSLSTEKDDQQKNIDLEKEGNKIYFEMRFDIPKNSTKSKEMMDTCCVQYDEKKNPTTSCESWYDDKTDQVVCNCEKYGLTVNVYDKALSTMNKLLQFPLFDHNICKLNIY